MAVGSEETGHPGFLKLLDEMRALHCRKAADYGHGKDPFANVRASASFGVPAWIGVMIRANDKIERVKAFIEKGSLKNESVEDSLLDLAAYALIALALRREETQLDALRERSKAQDIRDEKFAGIIATDLTYGAKKYEPSCFVKDGITYCPAGLGDVCTYVQCEKRAVQRLMRREWINPSFRCEDHKEKAPVDPRIAVKLGD